MACFLALCFPAMNAGVDVGVDINPMGSLDLEETVTKDRHTAESVRW